MNTRGIKFEMSIRQQLADNGEQAAINFCMSINNCSYRDAEQFVRGLPKSKAADRVNLPYTDERGRVHYR